ncbi:hypothetical protein [Methylobacterium sp. Leaf117]|uniref:hypothetical protein n=1 Tax=Methylobacterium sp. Leaf117 TaxID=1736260 RepID=UPI000A44FC15|nr:hypothetical protein [Methylobacterium sp. Leaf117]
MVCFRTRRWAVLPPAAVLLTVAVVLTAGPTRAQEPNGAPETEAPPAAAPKKRSPPRKPAAKPVPKPAAEVVPAAPPAQEPTREPASASSAVPTPAANLPGLTVLCETKAALYEGPKDFAVWVTRTGTIVVENPLRPLTPESTRVLEVVIAGKAATAYGPDLFALRRGGSPVALGALLGAPVQWDATPVPLPDTLNIVSEAGQSLAQLGFRECGTAPAVKSPPVATKDGAGKPAKKPRPKVARDAGGNAGAKAPPGLSLPQGAIE